MLTTVDARTAFIYFFIRARKQEKRQKKGERESLERIHEEKDEERITADGQQNRHSGPHASHQENKPARIPCGDAV